MSELAISPSYLKDDFPFLFICGPYILFPANIELISTYIFFHLKAFTPWSCMMHTMLELIHTYSELICFEG
jgi:hypothetical protein